MARQAASSKRLRSAMDSVLVHDMKNVGFRLNLLLDNLEKHYGDPEFKRSVETLLHSTLEKIDSIVGRFASEQNGILVKVSLSLNELLQAVIKSRQPPRGGSDERVSVVTDFGEVPRIWGDAFYLKNAFSSLFQNALEAASASGSMVHVATRVARRGRKKFACVEIYDDGAGLPVDYIQERLFRPYQTTKKDGVGLGLYTAQQIVILHGGEVEIHSQTSGGTMVRVILPTPRAGSAS